MSLRNLFAALGIICAVGSLVTTAAVLLPVGVVFIGVAVVVS